MSDMNDSYATLWTVTHQAPLSIDCPGENTGVDCQVLLQGSSYPGTEPESLVSPALAGRFFTISTTWEAQDQDRDMNLATSEYGFQ